MIYPILLLLGHDYIQGEKNKNNLRFSNTRLLAKDISDSIFKEQTPEQIEKFLADIKYYGSIAESVGN